MRDPGIEWEHASVCESGRAAEIALLLTCPRGLESALARELAGLGGAAIEEARGAVKADLSLELAYRACLWSRVANRVLLPLAEFPCPDADALYEGAKAIDWAEHLAPDGSLTVDFVGMSDEIRHTVFGARRVKDAVVDRLRRPDGTRPSVEFEHPDLRIWVRLAQGRAAVHVDLSGESLHRRGYRVAGHEAPLKENVAAGLLLLAGWEEALAAGRPFLDPMCGTGTLPIEAGLIAASVAPGSLGRGFGFERWRAHDRALWERLLDEARERDRRPQGGRGLPRIVGTDFDRDAIRIANSCLERAGLRGVVHVERRTFDEGEPPGENGLLLVNPPYGMRLGDDRSLVPTYVALGDVLKRRFAGWDAWVFSGNAELASNIGLKAARRFQIANGGIDCRLLHYPIRARTEPTAGEPSGRGPSLPDMLASRLARRAKHLGKWARREGIGSYRVYDADLPEYAFAIDRYEDRIRIEEYEAPREIDPDKVRSRVRQAVSVAAEVLEVPSDRIVLVARRAPDARVELVPVREADLGFLVDLADQAGTGLPLEHRGTRALVRRLAAGRRFLSLSDRAGAAALAAAAGGATATVSVHPSGRHAEWAARNLRANHLEGPRHGQVAAEVLDWARTERGRYDLVLLEASDPREGVPAALRLLAPGGVLLVGSTSKRFRLDPADLPGHAVRDLSRQTSQPDFERSRSAFHLVEVTSSPSNEHRVR